jgi:hypothetical protein
MVFRWIHGIPRRRLPLRIVRRFSVCSASRKPINCTIMSLLAKEGYLEIRATWTSRSVTHSELSRRRWRSAYRGEYPAVCEQQFVNLVVFPSL